MVCPDARLDLAFGIVAGAVMAMLLSQGSRVRRAWRSWRQVIYLGRWRNELRVGHDWKPNGR